MFPDSNPSEEIAGSAKVHGVGGGVDNDESMFDKVMKPVIQQLTASLKNSDL